MKNRRVDSYVQNLKSLFQATLRGGWDDDSAWQAIHALRISGNELIFSQARTWCHSSNARRRGRGAAVLAQLRRGTRERSYSGVEPHFRDESVALIKKMVLTESDLDALNSEIAALGHLGDASSVPQIASFASHPAANIRFAVACALGHYANDPVAVDALSGLMEDDDQDVRNWAIFGVGTQGEADSEALRLAFIRHLADPYLDAREEAAAALAKRQDIRVVRPLIDMFRRYGTIYCLCDAARDLLRLEDTRNEWTDGQYIAALEEAFPVADQPL